MRIDDGVAHVVWVPSDRAPNKPGCEVFVVSDYTDHGQLRHVWMYRGATGLFSDVLDAGRTAYPTVSVCLCLPIASVVISRVRRTLV